MGNVEKSSERALDRVEQRRRKLHSSRQLIRALVDYVEAMAAVPDEALTPVGLHARAVTAQTGAVAAARQFIAECGAD